MSTAKKPVKTPVEDWKLLPDFFGFGTTETVAVDKWVTPELVTTVTTVVANLLGMLALMGWLNGTDVETLTKAVTALVSGVSVVVVNSTLIWKFIAARFAAKQKLMEMKLQYAETVTIEKMRAAL